MNSNFNYSYMARSSQSADVGFSKKAFFRDTVKSNKVYNEI
jgi:hypothetical protein